MEVFCPPQLVDIDAVNFLQKLEYHKNDDELVTNYSRLKFAYPFATLLIAIGIRDLVRYRHTNRMDTMVIGQNNNDGAFSYLKHIGFFQFIGLNEGKEPNEAPGSSQYLPITRLSEKQFQVEGLPLQEGIDRECYRLASIIFAGKKSESRAHMLSYCLREIVRNVFEHANTKECYLMAQKWSSGTAEIAIADQGIGLFSSLKNAFGVETPKDAITLALKPGISSNTSPENNDEWQNSGFGLFVISELGLQLGEFAIASDNHILFMSNRKESWNQVPIQGTAAKLRINTNESEYFPNVLYNIVTKGESMAKTIPGAKRTASKKSKMAKPIW